MSRNHLRHNFFLKKKKSFSSFQNVYNKDASEQMPKNKYLYTETDKYKGDKSLEGAVQGGNYVRKYMAERGMLHPVETTSEMEISKMIAPLISQKAYSKEARDVMQKYNLDIGLWRHNW